VNDKLRNVIETMKTQLNELSVVRVHKKYDTNMLLPSNMNRSMD
jgi:hypothetical protein